MEKCLLLGALLLGATFANAETRIHPKFERIQENENEFRAEIIQGILFLQKKIAQETGKAPLRGTHAKGVCAKAEFEILEGNKVGIFAYPGKYPATVRFANAKSTVNPDQENDVRSMSFAVEMPKSISNENGRMDFSTNDATTFPINDVNVFAALMTLAQKGKFWGAIELGYKRTMAAKNAFELGAQQQKPLTQPYQKLRYWSGVPFLYGQDQAIKYSLKPCKDNAAQALTNDPNTLSLELARHLKNDAPACFEFQVQKLDAEKMSHNGEKVYAQDWIENATWEWNEQQVPFETIARLTLVPDSLMSSTDCEAVRMNVNINTTPDHIGLGSINRARTGAEQQSSKHRP